MPFGKWSNATKAAGAMAIVALLYGMNIAIRLAISRFDPSIFICVAPSPPGSGQVPIHVLRFRTGGYDGQYYLRLALEPFTNQQTALGIPLDHPAFRQQRILYPLLAHVLALGVPQRLPWTMLLLNYAAICALGFISGLFARSFGKSALWGLVIPFYPGLLFSLNRDLTEVLAISLAVAALYLLRRRQFLVGASILALAVLTRETMVLLAGALFAVWAWRMRKGQSGWVEGAVLTIPFAAFAALQLWLLANWGTFGVGLHAGGGAFGPPLAAMIKFIADHLIGFPTSAGVFVAYELVLLAGTILLAATAVSESALDDGVKLAWALYLALACFYSGKIWINDEAFMRVLSDVMVLSFLILLGSRQARLFRALFVLEFVVWNILALSLNY